jgi:hypothetical protein
MSLTLFKTAFKDSFDNNTASTWKSANDEEKKNGLVCLRLSDVRVSFLFDQDLSDFENQNDILAFQEDLETAFVSKECILIVGGK